MRNALISAIVVGTRSSGTAKTHDETELGASVVAQNVTNYTTLRFYDVINLISKKYIATGERLRLL